jgi:ABC-2 type transport system permease protein
MKVFSLFRNDFKRLLKDVGVIISLLLMPLVIIVPTILGADFSGLEEDTEPAGTPLVVADYDGGEIAQAYIKELGESLLVEQDFQGEALLGYELQDDPRCAQPGAACDEAVGRARLLDGSLAGVLILPEGLTAAFKEGKQTTVSLLFDPGGDSLLATQIEKISQGLAIKVSLTKQIEGAKGDFTDLNSISDPAIRTEIDQMLSMPAAGGGGKTAIHVEEIYPTGHEEKKSLGPVEQILPQMSVLFIFLFPMFLTAWIREEQENGLLRRLLSTPVGKSDLVAGKLIFGVLVCVVQMAVIFVLGILVSNSKGHSVLFNVPGFVLLTLALAATSTSLGLMIASTNWPTTIALAPMLLGGVLGGAVILPDYMPAFMQTFSFLMPQRYGVDGYLDLLGRGAGLAAVLPETGMLLLFTVIFAGFAIWRFDPLD